MTVAEWIDAHAQELTAVSRRIWENPEASEKEYFACRTLQTLLEKHGFQVDPGPLAGLDTAFKASFGTGRPRRATETSAGLFRTRHTATDAAITCWAPRQPAQRLP